MGTSTSQVLTIARVFNVLCRQLPQITLHHNQNGTGPEWAVNLYECGWTKAGHLDQYIVPSKASRFNGRLANLINQP